MAYFPGTDKIDFNPPTGPPPRPTSQKAATMASEPPEDAIATFLSFTEGSGMMATRADAIKYLKAKHNNLEQAVSAFFDGEDVDKALEATTWDESAWSADREGGQDQNLRPLLASAAPTRGPSPAPSFKQPSTTAEADADLQAALAASQADMPYQQQETGVKLADGTEKGNLQIATGDYTDAAQWAMVPTAVASTSEIVPDADIDQRKHISGEPRFIKQLPGADYLSAFLTICHSIPLAREALLLRQHVRPSYGEDADWWKGHPVPMPKIVNIVDGSLADQDAQQCEELVMEVQRVMAFLDASDRTYASAGALLETDLMKMPRGRFSAARNFLDSWERAAARQFLPTEDPLTSIFRTVIRQAQIDEDGDAEIIAQDAQVMNVLELPVNIGEGSKRDLTQELDHLLWGADNINCSATKNSCIDPAADVIAIHAYQQNRQNKSLRLEVPSEFYIDKYLDEHFEATVELREKLGAGRDRISRIENVEAHLTKWQHPQKSKQIDARAMLSHTLGHYNGEHQRNALEAQQDDGDQMDGVAPSNGTTESPRHADLAVKLERAMKSIDEKLARLAFEKEKTRRVLSEVSKESVPTPHERYSLRGVATKESVTYLLRQQEPSIDGTTEERSENDNTPDGMQWWRIECEPSALGATIKKDKMADYDVLRAVELEYRSALLVYASDRAVDPSVLRQADGTLAFTLPSPLQDFVRKDNQLFKVEQNQAARDAQTVPFSLMDDSAEHNDIVAAGGGKRGSEDSTRAQPDYDSDRFEEHATFGLGYDLKQGRHVEEASREDAPVHEIHLDDQEQGVSAPGSDGGSTAEMVEKAHIPLVPGAEAVRDDVEMGWAESQNGLAR